MRIGEILRSHYVRNLELRAESGAAGISTGFSELDARLSGLRRGNLILLAGQSLMGKTALALQIATHVANSQPVLYFSPGMTHSELVDRIVSQSCGVPNSRLLCADLDHAEWLALQAWVEGVYQRPLYIDDSPAPTIQYLVGRATESAESQKPELIVVDDIELIDSAPETVARELKRLAKAVDCPVLLLSQVCPNIERVNRRPLLSDLGDTATPADVVLFVVRDELSNLDAAGEAEILLAKNKNGPAGGIVPLAFHGPHTRFDSMYSG